MPDIILHQYEDSPFSQKVRSVLGIKCLQWLACEQPGILPKDELGALTGGYRRVPVLQIGADIFLDSNLIIGELDRIYPDPSVVADIGPGLAVGLSTWPDSLLMTVASLLYGGDRDSSSEYRADRSALLGMDFDVEAMARAWTSNAQTLRLNLSLLERQLADERAFLGGSRANILDASFYGLVVYMHCGKGRTVRLLHDFPGVMRWSRRMAEIGQGEYHTISRQAAIDIARSAVPSPTPEASFRSAHEPKPGDWVEISYHDYNTPATYGTLMSISPYKLCIRWKSHAVGTVMLHLPRTIAQLRLADI